MQRGVQCGYKVLYLSPPPPIKTVSVLSFFVFCSMEDKVTFFISLGFFLRQEVLQQKEPRVL